MTWRIGQEVGDHISPQIRVDRSIRLATLGNRRITARNLQMRYLGYDTGMHMTWRISQEVGDHVSPQIRVDRSIRLATLGNRRITAHNLHMHYLGRHGRRVSIQTIRNQLHASQLKSRKAAQKSLLTAGVHWLPVLPVSCVSLLALGWEILENFCLTPPLFSGPYLSVWSRYCDTISDTQKGIDTPMKWHNWHSYKHINPQAIAPQSQYSELLLLEFISPPLLAIIRIGIFMYRYFVNCWFSICILSDIMDGINRQCHQCDRCQMTLSSNYRLQEHIRTQHGGGDEGSVIQQTKKLQIILLIPYTILIHIGLYHQ